MKKIEIKVQHREDGDREQARVRVSVDGVEIVDAMVGGEPEDNSISRDYAWIVPTMKKLAEACGSVTVDVTEETVRDFDDD